MKTKGYRVITADRFLTVDATPVSVTIRRGETPVAHSDNAVLLSEGDRDLVAYLPLDDVNILDRLSVADSDAAVSGAGHSLAARLVPSSRSYHCRWKGDASYFHVEVNGERLENAAWFYPEAPESVSVLRDKVAFDSSVLSIDVVTESVA